MYKTKFYLFLFCLKCFHQQNAVVVVVWRSYMSSVTCAPRGFRLPFWIFFEYAWVQLRWGRGRGGRIALFYLCISMHCPADFTRPITDFTWTRLYQSPSNFRCVYINNTEKRSKSLQKKKMKKKIIKIGCKSSVFSRWSGSFTSSPFSRLKNRSVASERNVFLCSPWISHLDA